MIFLKKKGCLAQDNGMWTIFYDSTNYAKYKITFFADQYLKYISGPYYSVWIENRDGKCLIGFTGEGYAVHYPTGSWDWDTYFGKISALGWSKEVKDGLPDTDSKVKEIVNDPNIKKLLDQLLNKYSKKIINDLFERFVI